MNWVRNSLILAGGFIILYAMVGFLIVSHKNLCNYVIGSEIHIGLCKVLIKVDGFRILCGMMNVC